MMNGSPPAGHDASPILSAHGKVVLALKEGILNGTYPVGGLLPAEEELLQRLGVSRVSLREGVKQLEALGWLKVERGNGTRVTKPDFRVMESTIDFLSRFEIVRFHHLHQLRGLIEVENVADLAARTPAGFVVRLREANAAIRDNRTKPEGYIDADVHFHDLLLEGSLNPLFPLLMTGFRKYLLLSRRLSFAGPEGVLAAVEAHEVIIACIERGDAAAARLAMHEHLGITAQQLHL